MATRDDTLRIPGNKVLRRCNIAEVARIPADAPVDPKLFVGLGQERFLHALELCVTTENPEHNLYITDLSGAGAFELVEGYLKKLLAGRKDIPDPEDVCYLYNFENPHAPEPVSFKKGKGKDFKRRMAALLRELKQGVPEELQSPHVTARVEKVHELYEKWEEQIARKYGFAPDGPLTQSTQLNLRPLRSLMAKARGEPWNEGDPDEPAVIDETANLTEEQKSFLSDAAKKFVEFIQSPEVMNERRRFVSEANECIAGIYREFAKAIITKIFDKWWRPDLGGPTWYREKLLEYAVNRFEIFTEAEHRGKARMAGVSPFDTDSEEAFLPWEVKLFVDHTETEDVVPIIAGRITTLGKAVGSISRGRMYGPFGMMTVDHRNLSPGFFHIANGGYLILSARDVATVPGLWQMVKYVIKNQELPVGETPFVPPGYEVLSPEPIPARLKFILFGPAWLLQLFTFVDDEFTNLFKVHGDILVKVERTPEQVRAYRTYLEQAGGVDGMHTLADDGACALIEYAQRLAGGQEYLSTDFASLMTIMQEANRFVKKSLPERNKRIGRVHVEKAIEERTWRSSVPKERFLEHMRSGTLLVSVDGATVGQINGLFVSRLTGSANALVEFCRTASAPFALPPSVAEKVWAEHDAMRGSAGTELAFGAPMRVTAQVTPGKFSVSNSHSKAEMTGPVSKKADLIVEGLLRGRYGSRVPLSVHVTYTPEQTYGGVEGDSASLAQFYAIMSAVSAVPIRQGIAITGSVNQHGEVQPIGGANEKIEGFYDACCAKGPLTGRQGVIIPHQNTGNLMLRPDIAKAIEAGEFSVWSIRTLDEGIELLTEVASKEFDAIAIKRLKQFAAKTKKFYVDPSARKRRRKGKESRRR